MLNLFKTKMIIINILKMILPIEFNILGVVI